MNKKLLIKIILSIVILGVVVLSSYMLTRTYENGSITIELIDESGNVISTKRHLFKENEYLYDVIKNEYQIEMGKGSYEGMLLSINELKSSITDQTFIEILINNTQASYGVKDIALQNNDIIIFRVSSYA